MIIIGITGPAGCGKSTLASYLVQQHAFAEIAFADPLRDMLAAMLRIDREPLIKLLTDRSYKEAVLSDIGASPRKLMQTLGTEWGRNLINPDLWLALANQRIDFIESALRQEYNGIVISDVRFENEAKFVRDRGLLLHVARPDLVPIDKHESENGVVLHHRDQLILNQSIEFMYKQADGWVHELYKGVAA